MIITGENRTVTPGVMHHYNTDGEVDEFSPLLV